MNNGIKCFRVDLEDRREANRGRVRGRVTESTHSSAPHPLQPGPSIPRDAQRSLVISFTEFEVDRVLVRPRLADLPPVHSFITSLGPSPLQSSA